MSTGKRPASLRGGYDNDKYTNSGHARSPAGAMAIACVAASVAGPALAQDAAGTQLPTVNVEGSGGSQTSQQAEPASGSVPGIPYPGANPYADPNAPYKVNSSANTRLTEPLLDTPRTVTVIPKEVLEETQTTTVRELARTTPGVTLGTGEGGNAFGDVIFIRGFRASNDVYIDGVRDPGVTVRENFMTEQVEILKGPGSTVAGRGTTGGAINVVTKKPQDVNFRDVETTLGTDGTRRVTADVNQVISPAWSVRANGMWQEADVAGRDDVFDDRWGGAFAVTWKPTENFKTTFDYYHLDLDALPDWGVPYDLANNRPFTESGLARDTFYGVEGRDFLKGKQDIATLITEVNISENMTLTNKFRKGKTINDYVVSAPEQPDTSNSDPSQWTLTSAPKSRYQVNEIVANQTDVTWDFVTGRFLHTLVAGFELSDEDVSRDSYRNLDTESFMVGRIPGCSVNLWNPNTAGCWDSMDQLIRAGNPTLVNVETKSVFLLDTMHLSPRWILTGGVRMDDYDIELKGTDFFGNALDLNRQDTMFNWNGGLTFKPRPNGSIYLAAATSTNPVGQELDAGGDDYGGFTASSVPFAPERNTAYELGTKWELFDRHLLVTAALFQTTKENARETFGPRGASMLYDTGEYEVQGLELGLAGRVGDLSLFGGVVFLDSEILESINPSNVGAEFANIAHTTFSLLAKYQVTDRFAVGGQATYASKIKGGTFAATNGNVLPDHWRFDALAEYELTERIALRLNVHNITDEVYYDAFYRSGTPYVYVAPGRAAYLTTSFKF